MNEQHRGGNAVRLLWVALLATALDIAAALALRRKHLGPSARIGPALLPCQAMSR